MGCSLLLLAACMLFGFGMLVTVLPILIIYPWLVVAIACIWLGVSVYNRRKHSSSALDSDTSLDLPCATGLEWQRASHSAKSNYILRRNMETKLIFPNDVFPDPEDVLGCIDSYYLDPSKQDQSVAFVLGYASATIKSAPIQAQRSKQFEGLRNSLNIQ